MQELPLANDGGTVAGVIPHEERGAAMAIFAVGLFLGPVMGSFISEEVGWRWNFWVLAIIMSSSLAIRKSFFP